VLTPLAVLSNFFCRDRLIERILKLLGGLTCFLKVAFELSNDLNSMDGRP
jgi:hypothetical protein